MKPEIKIYLTPEELSLHLAGEIRKIVSENVSQDKDTFIALSGGSTPKVLFTQLSGELFRDKIQWNRIHLFWGDERCVSPEDEQSNYGMTKKYLLGKINIPENNVHRIRGENEPSEEVKRITGELKYFVPFVNNLPQFDINLLGLGSDGHTASLFPGKSLRGIIDRVAGIAVHPDSGQKRISLTYNTINNSKRNIFMVTGKKKSDIIFKILGLKNIDQTFPATKIKASDSLEWFLDEEAAVKIKKP